MARIGLVYLAGSIDSPDPNDTKRKWRAAASRVLLAHHIATFDPSRAFWVVTPDGVEPLSDSVPGQVVRINRKAIDESDVVLANLLYGKPFETLREIEYAKWRRKRVVAMTDTASFGAYDLECYHSINQAVSAIVGEQVTVPPWE